MQTDEIEALKSKSLCHACIGDAYLSNEIRAEGRRRKCAYCGKAARTYTISAFAERIEEVFEQHYIRTSDQPNSWQYTLLADKESDYEWERDGEPVLYAIMNATEMPEDAAHDIQQILEEEHFDLDAAAAGEENPFSSEAYYEEKGPDDAHWQEEWRDFEQSLKSQARYFNRAGAEHLNSIFDGIESMKTGSGRALVISAGPKTKLTHLYRARVFQSDKKLEEALARPDKHLGSPPSQVASAGRMNAHGIAVFYGASDANVALAEARPPVGSQVLTGRFEIIRPIQILDLTALSEVSTSGSVFDPTLADCLERMMFLRSLSGRISRPIMPQDESFDYLITQAIADFLANEAETPLDGILYPSVQAEEDALNAVLFHKAARVEDIALPNGAEVSAHTGQLYEEGWEREYTVIEEVPPASEEQDEQEAPEFPLVTDLHGYVWEHLDTDPREPTLRTDMDSIQVHVVNAVSFNAKTYPVRRHRWEKQEPPF